ncbi:hypothetical protein KFE25_012327 [Diacronema lutheri]|uniref:Uncharacterized protein n=1 Tax=Diacronema lutheri TaxID=2081491 RepID=A0A8J6C9W5_DIALT|nr:hypothetical protein KFE25_012327 [Diacronema lutheri]|mmetsp:Transcript_8134/g.25717  ORF Transcript_8134/g.25717 Transcript_8134/m.25717 type:complete len:183 (-) Transcript_8134:108-656(-)
MLSAPAAVPSARSRLRAKLESRGVELVREDDDLDEVEDLGKTLMQQVLEANTEVLEKRLAKLKEHKETNKVANKAMDFNKNTSKANPSTYVFKPSAADNPRARANVHHAGSHYHMAATRQFSHGNKVQGVVSRHSKQGERMQQARMAQRNMLSARDVAKGQNHSSKRTSTGPQKLQDERRGQ